MNLLGAKPTLSSTVSRVSFSVIVISLITIIIILCYGDQTKGWSVFYTLFIPVVVVSATLLLLVVVAARATMVTWITVLVLLAFAGNRRRVLVKKGRIITADVAMYLLKGCPEANNNNIE